MRKAAETKRPKASKSRLATAAPRSAARVKSAARAGGKPSSEKASRRAAPGATAPDAASRAGPARIALGEVCTLREAAALQSQLVAAASPVDTVLVDGAAVSRIDAAALQLLVAFARREQAAGRRIVWQQPSAALVECSARLGLQQVLGLDGGSS